MKAQLLTIGDELLIGQTTNTNAAWLGEQLSLLGLRVTRTVTVGDEASAIHEELDRAYDDASLVVTTGGLGPTHDDVTKKVVADYFGKEMEVNETLEAQIEDYYDRRGRDMPEEVKDLAEVPAGFELLDNPVGTAPGLWYAENSGGGSEERLLAVLPGIPQEMKNIFSAGLRPRLEARSDLRDVLHRTLLTTGIGESDLQAKIGDLSDELGETLRLAYLPSTSGVRLRLSAFARDRQAAEERLDRLEELLRERVDAHIFGTGNDTLEGVLGDLLRQRNLTLAVAESATGGLVGSRITDVAGSSDYFLGGIVSYAYSAKENLLGVSREVLMEEGAVCEPVARQMARGVRKRLGANVGIATTGIAGPTGGTDDKPVGTVWIGYSFVPDPDRPDADEITHARRLQLVNDRQVNKELFATSALEMVRRQLLRMDRSAAAAENQP